MARLEAVLFLAREPISSRRLAQLANLPDGTRARSLIRQLQAIYDASGRAFQCEEVGGGFQLLTRQQFAPWLRRLEHAPHEVRLSVPAMETLAVVAYRQPVLRAQVEAIRGVQSGEILRQLMERDLVRITGRAEELGRPFLYGTTKNFLQLFGLRHADELPRAEQLRAVSVVAAAEVANHAEQGHDMRSNDDVNSPAEEELEVTSATDILDGGRTTDDDEARAPIEAIDDEQELDDDEQYEYEDDEDEQDDEYEYEDDEEDDDEDDDDEEDLEGDWEEVGDDDELDDDEDDDEEDELEDDEDYEYDDDDDDDEEEYEEEEEEEEED